MSSPTLIEQIRSDRRANPRNPKSRFILAMFRVAHRLRGGGPRAPLAAVPMGVVYRIVVDWVMGVELPWRTHVGLGLTLEHGFGLVVNDAVVIGDNVTLRQGVTLGRRYGVDDCPVLMDGADIGASAIILGKIVVGEGASVGAGSVVLEDVPAGGAVVGNPARILRPRTSEQ